MENLKRIAALGWLFLTRLKSNRLVNPDGKGNVPLREVEIPAEGRVVHRKGFGFVKVFRTVSKEGDAEYWATHDLRMSPAKRAELEREGWGIEVYHRGIKQWCGAEKAHVRKAVDPSPFAFGFASLFEVGGVSLTFRTHEVKIQLILSCLKATRCGFPPE